LPGRRYPKFRYEKIVVCPDRQTALAEVSTRMMKHAHCKERPSSEQKVLLAVVVLLAAAIVSAAVILVENW
jgi:hypothetical protein